MYRARKILLKDKYDQYFVEKVVEVLLVKNDSVSFSKSSYLKSDYIRDSEEIFLAEKNSDDFITNNSSGSGQQIKYFINKRWKYFYREDLKNFERLK